MFWLTDLGTHWTTGCVDPRASLDVVAKRKICLCREFGPSSSSHYTDITFDSWTKFSAYGMPRNEYYCSLLQAHSATLVASK
jgi:hypothetical protein